MYDNQCTLSDLVFFYLSEDVLVRCKLPTVDKPHLQLLNITLYLDDLLGLGGN